MGHPASRPRFLNLWQMRMPATAWTSICHRISGVLMFIAIPFLVYLLQLSLEGDAGFARIAMLMAPLYSKLLMALLLWSFLHHLLAGLRFLGIDLEWGLDKASACLTARLVNGLGLLLSLALAWRFW